MRLRLALAAPSAVIAVLVTVGCTDKAASTGAAGQRKPTPTAAATAPASVTAEQDVAAHTRKRVTRPIVVAVGDIACEPGEPVTRTQCRQAATARLAKSLKPRHVLPLGDLQYEDGALRSFRRSYHRSWGVLKPVTRPVPGNHEYRTRGAAGYFRYFGQKPGSRGYYAFNVNSWRIYALNSNCAEVNCTRQLRWLGRDMRANPRRCTLLTMHHPRYSSGGVHGSDPSMGRFWAVALRHDADVALAGHDHHYERFLKMNAIGQRDRRGLVSFVVGTGGKSLYEFGDLARGSAARHNTQPGVLALKLGPARYSWVYKTVDRAVHDRGNRRCS